MRVDRDGTRNLRLGTPDGRPRVAGQALYATAWSLGDPGSGLIVSLQPSAFS
ncbi:hypothetical protein BH23ACT9_BH23ACT9_39970 [soil metagenome]